MSALDDLRAAAAEALEDDRPILSLSAEEPAILDEVRAALRETGRYYTGPRGLVAVDEGGVMRPVSPGEVTEAVGRLRVVVPRTKSGRMALPSETAARVVEAPDCPPLVRVATAPYPRASGEVVTEAGYDPDTGVYLAPAREDYPPPPDTLPEALEWARAPFVGCTVDARGKDTLVALVLTLVGRTVIEGPTPGFLAVASVKGSGKTSALLAAWAAATGLPGDVAVWPRRPEEAEKVLASYVAEGQAAVVFDNLPNGGTVGGPTLDALLTAGRYRARRLGSSETFSGTPPVVAFSGNNIATVGDTARRLLVVPFTERTAEADADLVAWALEVHPRALVGAVALLGAALRRGPEAEPLGRAFPSYGAWCRVVRDAIVLAGGEDVAPGDEDREAVEDEEADTTAAFVALVAATMRDRETWTTAELLGRLEAGPGVAVNAHERREALDAAGVLEFGNIRPHALSRRVKAAAGVPTPAGTLRRVRTAGTRAWAVEPAGAAGLTEKRRE